MSEELNIQGIVFFEKLPSHYLGISPFSATIHHIEELTIQERSVIQDALVNAGVKIKIMRGKSNEQTFIRK
jgi:hypothetical protein